jgi:1,4-dihydroxy-6-naphthoate synthase
MRLTLGISPCPNDTFAFHGILARKVDLRGLEFDTRLLDVQQLNEQLAAGVLDYSKASFFAALHLAGSYGVLRAGAALGMGVGPLLLAADDRAAGAGVTAEARVLCPGASTTATLLFQCLHPEATRIEHRVFSDIMPALKRGEADLGVVIHEGRFTYRREGLSLVEDLGASWERLTGGPVPLGGILGRLELPDDVHRRFVAALRDSIAYGYAHREEAFFTMQRHAQELEPAVIWSHVDLYVDERTVDLGDSGTAALATLQQAARRAGVLAAGSPPLRVLG